MFHKKGVLKNFTIFTGKHPFWSPTQTKRHSSTGAPAKFAKFVRTFFYRTLLVAASAYLDTPFFLIKNILRIMARLKYMINNLESPILILHQQSALFTMKCLLIYNGRSSISKNLCSKSTHKSIKTQLIEHRIESKGVIITLIEMSGRKRKQLTLESWKGFKEI